MTQDWNGLPLRLGAFELPVTIYPPFVLSLLAAIWLGPTWGLVPAYAANLAGALVSGLSPWTALLFALAGALEVLIFWGSMVTLNISPDLRRFRDFGRFFLVCLIAPITASLAILLWNTARGLDTTDGAARLARLGDRRLPAGAASWSPRCSTWSGRARGTGSTASSRPRRATR